MGRLPTVLLFLFVLVVLGEARFCESTPSGERTLIAIPDWVPMDRELDLFVFTEEPSVLVELPFGCFFSDGVYEAKQLAFLDDTGGPAGVVDGVISHRLLNQGTRVIVETHVWSCNVSGETYRVYEAITA